MGTNTWEVVMKFKLGGQALLALILTISNLRCLLYKYSNWPGWSTFGWTITSKVKTKFHLKKQVVNRSAI